MATISGNSGSVKVSGQEVLDVTAWELAGTAVTTRYASNSTGGFKRTVPGRREQSGRIEAKWDSAGTAGRAPNTVLREGQSVNVALILNDATEYAYQGTIVVRSFRVKVDVAEGTVTGCVIDFEADGQLVEGTP